MKNVVGQNHKFAFYEYDIHNKKWKILRKINYMPRNLDKHHEQNTHLGVLLRFTFGWN